MPSAAGALPLPCSGRDSKEIHKNALRVAPYNYTLAYENATKGWPLARPLNFSGDNPATSIPPSPTNIYGASNVLVAPVMEQGARRRRVVFPAGEWINWNDPTLRYHGGTEATVNAPLDELPMFVRAGSFIPQYDKRIENVGQYDPQRAHGALLPIAGGD